MILVWLLCLHEFSGHVCLDLNIEPGGLKLSSGMDLAQNILFFFLHGSCQILYWHAAMNHPHCKIKPAGEKDQ